LYGAPGRFVERRLTNLSLYCIVGCILYADDIALLSCNCYDSRNLLIYAVIMGSNGI